jgi:hypothetical protein
MNDWLSDIFDVGLRQPDRAGAKAVCEVCKVRKAQNPNSLFPVCTRCDHGDHLTQGQYVESIEQEDTDETRPRGRSGEDRGPI